MAGGDSVALTSAAPTEEVEPPGANISFLFKLTPGVAHRSFGLNVARMAGLPPGLVRRAGAKATEMEQATAGTFSIARHGIPQNLFT